jgi:hypothetical protein
MWASESQFASRFESFLYWRSGQLGRQGKGSVVLREYNPGYGRPDMVQIVYDLGRLQERKKSIYSENCRQFDSISAFAMAYLTHRRWVLTERLGDAVSAGPQKIKKVVSRLEARGLIETQGNLVKACAKAKNLVIDRIEAFELKLENWQRAVEQAGRHLWFASQSYIVMPERSTRLKNQMAECCVASNIGLILCETEDNWETLTHPPRAIVPTSHIGWLLNEWVVSGESYARLRIAN